MGGDFNFGGGGGAGVQFDESVLYKIDETSGSKDMTSVMSENEHINGKGYDYIDSSDRNLSESESESVERWVSIGGGGGCGSCMIVMMTAILKMMRLQNMMMQMNNIFQRL